MCFKHEIHIHPIIYHIVRIFAIIKSKKDRKIRIKNQKKVKIKKEK